MDASITLDGVLRGCLKCGVVVINPSGWLSCLDPVAADLLHIAPTLPSPLTVLPAPVLDFARAAITDSDHLPSAEVRIKAQGYNDQILTLDALSLSSDSETQGLLLLLRGVQSDHALEARIRHFERLARLGVLSAGLAHELRNSMVALSTLADVLIERQQVNELTQTIRRELDRANTLTVQMLKYGRPDTESLRPVSTHEILQRALLMAKTRFRDAGASVTQSLQADPDLITADEAHLEQVFLNLLLNAADAIDANGDVRLGTEIAEMDGMGRAVRVSFKDNGGGITPEVLPHLFQPFFTTKRHGTGLGLYLAQRIVNDHAGRINVESTPGQGTCVEVYLPVHSG